MSLPLAEIEQQLSSDDGALTTQRIIAKPPDMNGAEEPFNVCAGS